MTKPTPIPVIMFHTVRPASLPWFWSHISCPPELFESYLKYLKAKGYSTVRMTDVADYVHGRKDLPGKPIALTFDDGYLDNWTIAAPVLEKYGFSGTVFVNPTFVDPREIVRKQVRNGDEVTGDLVDGFMSWDELRLVDKSGVLDVQSHGMSHTWYPSSDEIIDFHHPGDGYPWLAWNARPERKSFWTAEDQSEFVGWGVPIYRHEKSFIVRRYFEPEELNCRLVEFVQAHGGRDFFNRADWRTILHAEAGKFDGSGTYETEDEYRERVEWELRASKDEISSRLDKQVDIICWPGGGHSEITEQAALDAGYVGWTIRGLSNAPGRNTPDIGRISIPILDLGIGSRVVNRFVLAYQVEGYRGSPFWREAKWLVHQLGAGKMLLKREAR